MFVRRCVSLLALMVLSACAADRSDDGSSFHLGFPHIGLPLVGGSGLRDGARGMLQKDAEGGKPVLLWGDTSLGDGCTPVGDTRLEVVGAPVHGEVAIKPGRMYALYPEGDKHAACSGRLVTGTLAYFTGERNFSGADQVVLKATRADGDAQQVTVDITVFPARELGPAARRSSHATPPLPIAKPTIRDPAALAPAVLQTPYPGE